MKRDLTSTNDYLQHVAEFIAFLTTNETTLEKILSHMILVVLSPLNAEAILIRQLNDENQALLVATWGIPLEYLQPDLENYSLKDKYPTTDTLRHRRTTWVHTLPDWGVDYPLLKDSPYSTGAKSYICFPIEKAGTPVAALGIFSRDEIHPDAEIEAFLRAVGNVFSMHMFRQNTIKLGSTKIPVNHLTQRVGSTHHDLTERQQVILRLISENRTNLQIGEFLGYSEPTIRQEMMSIFAKLNCTGVKEAAAIYRERETKSKNIK